MPLLLKNKKGMTFTELIVAISILSIGMAGFTMLFISSWKSNSFIIEEGMAAAQASNSVRKISKELREIRQAENGDFMIKAAGENELVVYLDESKDGFVDRVRYYVDEDEDIFIKSVAEASGDPLNYPENYDGDEERIIARFVMNGALTEPVFKYYDNENELLSSSPTLTDIRLIEVNLWINIKPETAPDNVRIGTSVELRNLDESI